MRITKIISHSSDESIDEDVSDGSEMTLENLSDSDYESCVLEPIQEELTPPPSPVKKVKRKYTKREPRVGIATSDPNIQVIMKSKSEDQIRLNTL